MHCPLCENTVLETFRTRRRPQENFRHCGVCGLVSKEALPRPAEEKARYDQHRNGDEGHRRFLRPVVDEVRRHFSSVASGIDWGSGPRAVLAEMLQSEGFQLQTHDPFFGPYEAGQGPFDFITLTEVIEHMHRPGNELRGLRARLRSGGLLFVQTDMHPGGSVRDVSAFFENWGYRNDPTHVSFFTADTFRFLEGRGWTIVKAQPRVTVLRRTEFTE